MAPETEYSNAGFFNVANLFTFMRVPLAIIGGFMVLNESTRLMTAYYAIIVTSLLILIIELRTKTMVILTGLVMGVMIITPLIVLWTTDDMRIVGVVIIMLAAWTDFFDGKFARGFGIVTKFGELADPTSDKLLMAFTTAIMVVYFWSEEPTLLFWVGVVAICELVIMGYTFYVMYDQKQPLKVDEFGKNGIFARMTGVTWLLLSTFDEGGFYTFCRYFAYISIVLGVIFAAFAMLNYIDQHEQMRRQAVA